MKDKEMKVMTKIGKRLAAVFLAVAMVAAFIPVLGTKTVYAEGDYPDVPNVSIDSTGLMT